MATIKNEDEDQDNVSAVKPTEGAEVEVEEDKPDTQEQDNVEVVEDDGSDERINQADEDEDEEKPHRARETAAERRLRQKQAKERDKRELDFQRKEIARMDKLLSDLQRGQAVNKVTELDSRIATEQNNVVTFERVKAAAITKNNGVDAVQADNLRNEAAAKVNQMLYERQQIIEAANKPVVKPLPYMDMAQSFMRDVPWYNPNGQDADSTVIRDIDNQVATEYVPTSPKYWQELRKRVAKHFPEKFRAETDEDSNDEAPAVRQQTRKGPPTGGSSRSSNSSTANRISLSPERVAAMKEAGVWEDPKTRARYAKVYANYDKQQKANG